MCNRCGTRCQVRSACKSVGRIPDYRAKQFARTCDVLLQGKSSSMDQLKEVVILAAMLSR